jgi:uncharacterized protein (TIGR02246 family)
MAVTEALRGEIADLLTAFTRAVDGGDAEGVAALFTADGVIEAPHFTCEGREAILNVYADPRRAGRLSKHMWSNLHLVEVADDRVEVEAASLTLVGAKPAPSKGGMMAAGMTYDTIVRQGGRWCFARRRLEMLFETALPAPAAP